MEAFKSGALEVIATVRTLDEGVDVPEADLGIVLAASRQKRQMIQRMGRVLRRKADGRHARFVEVADGVADFDATADPEELREWLAPGA